MADPNIYNPFEKEVRGYNDPSTNMLTVTGGGMDYTRTALRLAREFVAKGGYPLNEVPVVHRFNRTVRHWDLRQGQPGASHCCELLCSMHWRFATPEEVAQALAKDDAYRAEIAKAKCDADAGALTKQLFASIANAQQAVENEKKSKKASKKSEE